MTLPACRELLGANCPPQYVLQVERVAAGLLGAAAEAAHARELLTAFRSAKLIPDKLIDACRRRRAASEPVSAADAATAVCFAASIYPRRAYQLEDEEMETRLDAFLEIYQRLAARESHGTRAAAELVEGMSSRLAGVPPPEVDGALSDLTASTLVPAADPAETRRRQTGSAVYLTSCTRDLVRLTLSNWREDAGFLRYLRRCLAAPPSCLTRRDEDCEHTPDWDAVRRGLADLLPGHPQDYHARAVMLEQALWNEARRWVRWGALADHACEFWEKHWDALNSGFPYYAFLCRFPHWWKQCLARFRFGRHAESLDEVRTAAPANEPGPLEPTRLRCAREGYRLLRTTFFPRGGGESGGEPAQRNDRLRELLDELWYRRLAGELEGDAPAAMVKDIHAKYGAEYTLDAVNNLSHRLHRRFWAYHLARFKRWRNSEIRWAKRPGTRRGAGAYPLAQETAVPVIASLARLVPPDRTLLWAFTARLFLHPLVEPQRPDPWTFARYLVELWHWVTDPSFDATVRAAAQSRHRPDMLAAVAFEQGPWHDLIAELRRNRTPAEAESWVRGRTFEREWQAGRELAERAAGPGLRIWTPGALRQWRAMAPPHWIVPVWYAVFVLECPPSRIAAMLQADTEEADAVTLLAEHMLAAAVRSGQGQTARMPLAREAQ